MVDAANSPSVAYACVGSDAPPSPAYVRIGSPVFVPTLTPNYPQAASHCTGRGMEFMDIEAIFPNGLDIDDALKLLWPAAFYILGMAAYGFFVFKFYRFIASRDMFELDLSKNEESRYPWVRDFFHLVLYGAKYIILFPVFAYFWFAALTLILTLLSKDRSFSDILLIAFATVSAIRLAAYYNEELSRDMAKILPFAVLAIFLIDASFFKIAESLEALKEANDHRESIFYYLLFLIAVEFALRLILAVVALLVSVRKRISQEPLADDSDGAPMPPPGEEPSQEGGDVGADVGSAGAPPTTQSP